MKRIALNSGFDRLRPIAGACLLGAVTACASLNGTQNGTQGTNGTASQGDFHLVGVPPALASRANALLNTGQPAPRSVLEKRNRADSIARSIENLLASEGYFAAQVSAEQLATMDTNAALTVDSGPLFTISSITLNGIDTVDADTQRALDVHLATLRPGSVARTADVERIEALIVTTLQQRGYAFAKSPGIDALASREESDVEITYTVTPGPLVKLGDLVSNDPSPRGQKAIQTLKTWKTGATYTPRTIDRLRSRLRSTELYEGIGVVVSDEPDADGYHTVSLTLADSKRRSISFGATASTTEGVGADVQWEKRNITGRADTVTVRAEAATLSRGLTGTYELPNIGKFGRTLTTELGVRQEETQAYDLDGVKLAATLSQPFTRQLTLSVGAAVDATRITDQSTRIYLGDRDQVTFSIPVSATYTDVGDPLDPQEGVRAFASVESGISLGDGTPGYTRMQISGATYRKIADDLVAAFRAEYGAFAGSNAVPTDRLFFAGGGGTVRGYEYQSLSPTDSLGEYLGGRSLFSASAELRWRRSERFGYAAFVDFGAASDDPGAVFGESKAAAGLGIRYYPGFGPIRFDIAAPLNKRDGDSPVQIYVSIGQAF
ncbi:BamA/TamA family outer membrane protein [Hyphomonas sp. WL0036]|uniref:autotransporter assembly complex protein TamA n=1 Tax=Hyphomonas sediminis TaxID=2866160 RepID=UPI001C803A79|nr:BamA/TamA family outer membrane protein [Hyphomonas sediminis]MBY9067676.1 BamA/TamA family outer membrane protein [Hyphomonas sediminis]